jgi:hypothetical protein
MWYKTGNMTGTKSDKKKRLYIHHIKSQLTDSL